VTTLAVPIATDNLCRQVLPNASNISQRDLLLERIRQMMELLMRLTKDRATSLDFVVLGIIYDLFELYQQISRRHYIAPRTISAGRHQVANNMLENLIKAYPEPALRTLFRISGWRGL